MARTALPLLLPDVAAFTRALGRALHDHHASHGAPPGHQALLNAVARAAGWRNFQALNAQSGSMPEAAATPMASAAALYATAF